MNVTWQDDAGLHTEPEVNYHQQWQAFALRRNGALSLLYLWPAEAFGLFYVSRNYLHQPVLAMGLILVWLAVAFAAVWWAGEFRCPRCRRRYGALGHKRGSTNLTRGIFDAVCSNCKLRKFEFVS